MINNSNAFKTRKTVPVDKVYLYRAQKNNWSYCHHAFICFFKGRFYAMWSNGRVHEDDCGQRVLISSSHNAKVWSPQVPLYDSLQGDLNEVVLTAGGFYIGKEQLIAYAGCYEYAPENVTENHYIEINKLHKRTRLLAKTSFDGIRWSKAVEIGLPIVPNHGPQRLNSGRLMITGGFMFPYSDESDGISGWKIGGIYPKDWKDVYDDSEGVNIFQQRRGGGVFLCEGAFYQTDDDVIHMLLRSDKSNLWATESRDNGETWCQPYETCFSNCNSKLHAGRLPDGRFYVVSNPDPDSERCPLTLCTSEDGENFDREYIIASDRTQKRISGLHKNGIYGYPHSLIHNDCLYVICSIHKEDIAVYSCSLSNLKS